MRRNISLDVAATTMLAWALVAPVEAQGAQARDEAALRKLVSAQMDAWNRHDAVAWSKDFAVDAEYVNVLGSVLTGKAAIEQRYAFLFEGPFRNSRVMMMVRRITFLANDLAVIDMNLEVTGHGPLPGVAPSDSSGVLRTRTKYITRRSRGRWQIILAQDTDVKPVAGMAPALPTAAGTR